MEIFCRKINIVEPLNVNNKQQLQIPNRYFTKLTLTLQSVI